MVRPKGLNFPTAVQVLPVGWGVSSSFMRLERAPWTEPGFKRCVSFGLAEQSQGESGPFAQEVTWGISLGDSPFGFWG